MVSKDSALQFALMVKSGMPPIDVIGYFYPDVTPAELHPLLKEFQRSDNVKHATLTLQGKPWQDMSLDEQIRFAVDKTYSEMAYFLYSHNYSTLSGHDKLKADTCRQSLESKIAGTSGQMNPLTQFWEDIRKGKVQLGGGGRGAPAQQAHRSPTPALGRPLSLVPTTDPFSN
jgi:hypothetical protein